MRYGELAASQCLISRILCRYDSFSLGPPLHVLSVVKLPYSERVETCQIHVRERVLFGGTSAVLQCLIFPMVSMYEVLSLKIKQKL